MSQSDHFAKLILCLVAILCNFQNGLIFPILALFLSRFLHRTTAMCCRNVFSMCCSILIFWANLTILQSLEPLLCGHFWQFSKWSHFSNISFFGGRFLHRTTAICCRNIFSIVLGIFNFWAKGTILQSQWALLGGHFWQFYKMVSFFEY